MAINSEILASNFMQRIMEAFQNEGETKIYPKGDFILREGQVEKKLYFIETGAVKLFYLTEFEEKIIRFGYNGSTINSLSSFLNEQPSEFYIEALRKTKIKAISKEKLLEIAHSDIEQYCKFLEILLAQQIDREVDLLITSPAQRLERVLQRSPGLFQHIPLKYIASYLRMNPETLSRIRNS